MTKNLPDGQVFNTSDSPMISSTRKSVGVSLSVCLTPADPGLVPTPPTGTLSTIVRGLDTVGKLSFSSLGLFFGVDL